jgi:hypothetical protein
MSAYTIVMAQERGRFDALRKSNSAPAGRYGLIIEAGMFCLRCGFTTEGVRT